MQVDQVQCVRYFLKEEGKRGIGGIVLICADEWKYLLPNEWKPESFCQKVSEVYDSFGETNYIVFVEHTDKMDVFMIPKTIAANMALG